MSLESAEDQLEAVGFGVASVGPAVIAAKVAEFVSWLVVVLRPLVVLMLVAVATVVGAAAGAAVVVTVVAVAAIAAVIVAAVEAVAELATELY